MPMSRLPRSDWLGSSTSPFLTMRSNLSPGAMAACAAPPVAASATEPTPARKSRREALSISPSPELRCRTEAPASAAGDPLRVDVERIDRMAGRHEKPVALGAAEAEVGGALRQRDEADRLAAGIEHLDAVELGAHAPAAPQIAIDVDAETVRRLVALATDQFAAVGEFGAVVGHVELVDGARAAAFDDVKLRLVGRERETVRPLHQAGGGDSRLAGPRIDPVDVVGQFLLGRLAEIVARDAGGRIGEPDGIVRLHHHVVGAVERLAVELVDQHRDGAVVFRARDAAAAVLAGNEASLAIV